MTRRYRRVMFALWLCACGAPAMALPDFADVRQQYRESDGVLLDRHGAPLHELRVDASVRRLAWVPLADISPALTHAVVQSEDRRFFRHGGVDWMALAGSAVSSLWRERARGASTITMQLAAQLDKDLAAVNGRRDLRQKLTQIGAAREFEQHWTKEQILEAYLNLVYYRGELQGVAAAARALFDKHPSGLDEPESLLLAALLRAPGAAPEKVAARACRLGEWEATTASCTPLVERARHVLTGRYTVRPIVNLAPHVARALITPERRRVHSTLDVGLQRFATAALERQLAALTDERVSDGAVLVVDNASGEILAYVGNRGDSYVDGVLALRQAGSTLKPFLYARAIESNLLTAASALDDSPVNLITPTGLYVPNNYDNEYKGMVTLRKSLGSSLNIPAVRALMLVGPDNFLTDLRRLGFELPQNGDYYGYALALGSAEVSLWQLVNAYRTLANGGLTTPMRFAATAPRAPVRVLTRATTFVVSDILADRSARVLTFGLENVLATPFWSAVKTGTSKDMRDNWCIGYSDRFTVGVWVGNFDGKPMQNVSGVTGAAPVWFDTMRYLHRHRPSRAPTVPRGVVATTVEFSPGFEEMRREWFVRGTEVTTIKLRDAENTAGARIAYPANGTIMALDPDIPSGHQRVFFETTGHEASLIWRLDDMLFADARRGWSPVSGTHRLELLTADGAVSDAVAFEVRGLRSKDEPAR